MLRTRAFLPVFLIALSGCALLCDTKLDAAAAGANVENVADLVKENDAAMARVGEDPAQAMARKLRNDAALALAKSIEASVK